MAEENKGILEGIRIVEVGSFINGIGAGFMLGDMGAEVIKIEDPVRGDSYRGMKQMFGDVMYVKGRHLGFELFNRNKKGMLLDLKKEKGREILYKLIEHADVFLTNYDADICKGLGADYDTLKKHNKRLIYAQATGYGSKGKLAKARVFDLLGLARSGLMWQMGERDLKEPVVVGAPLCDTMGSIAMAYGILAALLARERWGISQRIETSLLGSALFLNCYSIQTSLIRGRAWARHTRKRSRNQLTNYYRCKDDRWVMLCEPQTDRFWGQFCKALNIPTIEKDPRFENAMVRRDNAAELIELIDKVFAEKTVDEWLKTFAEKGYQGGYSPVYDVDEAARDSNNLDNKYTIKYEHPVFGECELYGFPVDFEKTQSKIHREAPEHGQHTEEILQEVLGYDWDKITELKNEGVF